MSIAERMIEPAPKWAARLIREQADEIELLKARIGDAEQCIYENFDCVVHIQHAISNYDEKHKRTPPKE